MNIAKAALGTILAGLLAAGCGPEGREEPADEPTAAAAPDERYEDFGSHVLYFNAQPTADLQPEIAKQYGIVRSKKRAMLNVSIVKKLPGSTGQPVPGEVTVTASNLTGQLKNVTLREIKDGGAVYYIADLPVANGETLKFDIEARPVDFDGDAFPVSFTETFYSD
jgi:hypothetical protein